MFDVGFSELMVIGVVALLVLGPERLPKVAKTAGHLVGRMQRYVAEVKADINREVEASELKELKNTLTDAATSMQDSMNAHASEISREMKKTEDEFNRLSNPMMHFGLGPAGSSAEPQPLAVEGHGADPQAQLDLKLDENDGSRSSSAQGA